MNFRELLKAKTMVFHKEAEETSAKFAPIDTQRGYNVFLMGMHRVYTRYASVLDQGSTLMKLPPRSQEIMRALEEDLGTFPTKPLELKQKAKVPSCDKSLLSASYVFEGSALGSHILIKKIPIHAKSNYFKLLINDSPLRWPRTVKFLSNFNEGPNDDDAISVANEVFGHIAQTMKDVSIELK